MLKVCFQGCDDSALYLLWSWINWTLNKVYALTIMQVRLIGYAVEGSLFIVYEFMANGNLRQHLRGFPGSNNVHLISHIALYTTNIPVFSGKAPLSWSSRVQIALDAARGLEYIHEHTNPAYVHHDIKSSNILLDINLRAKVKVIRVIDNQSTLFHCKPN